MNETLGTIDENRGFHSKIDQSVIVFAFDSTNKCLSHGSNIFRII